MYPDHSKTSAELFFEFEFSVCLSNSSFPTNDFFINIPYRKIVISVTLLFSLPVLIKKKQCCIKIFINTVFFCHDFMKLRHKSIELYLKSNEEGTIFFNICLFNTNILKHIDDNDISVEVVRTELFPH